jgi:tetratricopeptide (TPR) repeat protein
MAARNSPPPMPTAAPAPAAGADWAGWAAGAVLAAAAVAAYRHTFAVPFQFDDRFAIAENPSIRHWATALSPPLNTTVSARPVLNASFAVNYAVGGLGVRSYHLLNLVIHLFAGLTLFGIVRRTVALRPPASRALPLAFGAALLWLLHPLQTESVTYIVQRAESLMGLFYLLTLYAFIRSAATGSRAGRSGWAAAAVLACLLGMATKEVMVSAPVMVLFYDRTFLAGGLGAALRRRRGIYAGLAATWLVLPFLVLSAHGRAGTSGFGSGVSVAQYWPSQFSAIWNYLRLSIWPRPQVFDYGTQWVTGLWPAAGAALVVLGLAGASAWALCRPDFGARALGFAGLWFFAILAPTSLIPGNRQTAAEHRMYLALVPVIVLAVIGLYRWLGQAAWVVVLAWAGALFGLTVHRNEIYRSALRLWQDTVAQNPDNPWAHNDLGSALAKEPGGGARAIAEFETALRLKPDYADAHSNLGAALLKVPGRLEEATAHCAAAVRLDPDSSMAHNNLGDAWSKHPERQADAITQFEIALQLDPESAEAHNNLGNAWLKTPGRRADAIAQLEAALRLDPNAAEIHNNLGSAWAQEPGRRQDAIAEYQAAIRLKPDFADARNNLGSAWAAEPDQLGQAIAEYESALRLEPNFAAAHYNLGVVWLNLPGKAADAIPQFKAAIQIRPDFAEAHYNLGLAWSQLPGKTAQATAEYEAAVRLKPDFAEARNNLGTSWVNLPGRLDDAITQFEAAARLKPDNAVFRFNLAVALLRRGGRTAEAVAHLEEVLRLQPGNATARRILARVQAGPAGG